MHPRPNSLPTALLPALFATIALAGGLQATASRPPSQDTEPPQTELRPSAAPSELFEIDRVVDGDTLWIRRRGELEKLRLLSVDTEEKLSYEGSATKPGTVFGDETSLWAQNLFEKLGTRSADGVARIGLAFPPGPLHAAAGDASQGVEAYDVYGRLLCHVILPDGTDFNLLLVRLGKSPYFNKYGNSELAHEAFVEAQQLARAEGLGIWDPETNTPRTAGAPAAKRDYDKLMPWWELRAQAIDRFRQLAADAPLEVVAADDPEALARAFEHQRALPEDEPGPLRVFGLVDRVFDEDDGSLTVLLRSGAEDAAVRFVVDKEQRSAFQHVDFEGLNWAYQQNYAWFTGQLEPGSRGGYVLRGTSHEQVEIAHPRSLDEPPAEAGAPRPEQR